VLQRKIIEIMNNKNNKFATKTVIFARRAYISIENNVTTNQ